MEKPEAYERYEEALKATPPDILYHYTSPEAALNILRSNGFWATEARYLNDPTDVFETWEIARKVQEEYLKDFPLGDAIDYEKKVEEFAKNIDYRKAYLAHLYMFPVDFHKNDNVFLISLSANGDSLPQWRAYCPNGGYSLGF